MARQGEGVAWVPQSLAAEDIEAGHLVDPGLGRFSIDVEIRLFRPVHRLAGTAEAFWKAVPHSNGGELTKSAHHCG
jgi:LysR family transcriptional regulator, hypochlorite-specific transcription factor HypT